MPTKLVCIKCGKIWTAIYSPAVCTHCGASTVPIAVPMSAYEQRCSDCIKVTIVEGVMKCQLSQQEVNSILSCPEGEQTLLPAVRSIFTLPTLSGSLSLS